MRKKHRHSNNIKLLRIWRDLTQDELAKSIGCSQYKVSVYENGLSPLNSVLREAFAAALDVPGIMLDGEITIIPKSWGKLVEDPRMPILVEELLSYDSKRLSRLVHSISERIVNDFGL